MRSTAKSIVWLLGGIAAAIWIAPTCRGQAIDAEALEDAKAALRKYGVEVYSYPDGLSANIWSKASRKEDDLKQIVGLLKLTKCWELHFDSYESGPLPVARLKQYLSVPTIRSLRFSTIRLTSEHLDAVAHTTTVSRITLGDTVLSKNALRPLAKMASLKWMGFFRAESDANDFTDEDLVFLKDMSSLEELYFEECPKITDVTFQYAAGCRSLERLSIRFCPITDESLKPIGKLKNLRQLSIVAPQRITDTGVVHLRSNQKLEYLGLEGTSVSVQGISTLKGFVKLNGLSLSPVMATPREFAELVRAWPAIDKPASSWLWDSGIPPDACHIWDLDAKRIVLQGNDRGDFVGKNGFVTKSKLGFRIYDVRTGQVFKEVLLKRKKAENDQYYLTLSPDGRLAAFTDGENRVQVVDWQSEKTVRTIDYAGINLTELKWSPDSKWIVLGVVKHDTHPGAWRFVCLTDEKAKFALPDFTGFDFTPAGDAVLYSEQGEENRIRRVGFPTGRPVRDFDVPGWVDCCLSDGRLLLYRRDDDRNSVRFVVDLKDSTKAVRVRPKGMPERVAGDFGSVSPNGRWAVIQNGTVVELYEIETGNRTKLCDVTHRDYKGRLSTIDSQFSPDSRRLLIVGAGAQKQN